MHDEAIAEYIKNESLGGVNQGATEELNAAYTKSGWRGFYQKELKLLEEASKRGYVSPKYFVLTHLQLGDKEQAFSMVRRCLQRACRVAGLPES